MQYSTAPKIPFEQGLANKHLNIDQIMYVINEQKELTGSVNFIWYQIC